MKVKFAVSIAALGLALAGALPAHAVDHLYVSTAGESIRGYTVPAIAIRPGDTITYANFDIDNHDVVSSSCSAQNTSGCGPMTPECQLAGKIYCPKFWTPLIGFGQTTPVYGAAALAPGTYSYLCTLHRAMRGTLVVLPA